jgi:hypothetical protein
MRAKDVPLQGTDTGSPLPRWGALPSAVVAVSGLTLCLLQIAWSVRAVTDFTQDYLAARALLSGRSIYAPFVEADVTEGSLGSPWTLTLADRVSPAVDNYHPPFVALLFVPLAWLPYHLAFFVWSALSIVLYLYLWWLVWRGLHFRLSGSDLLLGIGLALLWTPLQSHLAEGQLGMVIAACVCTAWFRSRQRESVWSGVLIGLASLVKLFPLLYFAYFLVRKRWLELVSGLLTFSLGLALTLAVVGWPDVSAYVKQVAFHDTDEHGASLYNISLWGAVGRLVRSGRYFQPVVDLGRLAVVPVLLTDLVVLGVVLWDVRRALVTREGEDHAFALVCVAMLLLSPVTWQHGLVLLILPLAILWRGRPNRLGQLRLLTLFVVLAIPVVAVAQALVRHYWPEPCPPAAVLPLLLPTVALLALAWWLMRVMHPAPSLVPPASLISIPGDSKREPIDRV